MTVQEAVEHAAQRTRKQSEFLREALARLASARPDRRRWQRPEVSERRT